MPGTKGKTRPGEPSSMRRLFVFPTVLALGAALGLPVELLFFGDDGFDAFDELEVCGFLVQGAIGAGAINIETEFPFHALGSRAVGNPCLAVSRDTLPTLRQGDRSAECRGKHRHPPILLLAKHLNKR